MASSQRTKKKKRPAAARARPHAARAAQPAPRAERSRHDRTAVGPSGFAQTLASIQRAVVLATTVGGGVMFWRYGLDNFDLVKLTVVLVAAVLLVALEVAKVVSSGTVTVPVTPVTWAAGAFVLLFAVATAASDHPLGSVLGVHRRYGGLLLYMACAILLWFVLRLFDRQTVRRIPLALVAAGAVVAFYGAVQAVGLDPLGWDREYGDAIFSTFGNPNFASGYLAICLPPTCWLIVSRKNFRWVQVGAVLLAALMLWSIAATKSDQGFAAAGAGLAVLAVAWLLDRKPSQRTLGLAAVGVTSIAAAGLVAAGLLGAGPLTRLSTQASFALRGAYWRAAVTMAADHPLLGVGPDRYGVFYRRARSLDAALAVGLPQGNDAAHNVVLQHAANGGVPLGLAYLAVVACVGWALVTGLRRLSGHQRLLLGALGGSWVAYQVQSFVSIDVPGLAMVQWVLGGAVVVVAVPPRLAQVRLPWASAKRPALRGAAPHRGRAVGGASVLALVGVWAVSIPLRADTAAGTAERLAATERVPDALDAVDKATSLAPWEPTYWFERGDLLQQESQTRQGLQAFEQSIQRAPEDLRPVLAAARVAQAANEPDIAQRWYDQALVIEPQHPDMKVEVAEFMIQQGRIAAAVPLLEAALAVAPNHKKATQLLAAASDQSASGASQ